MNIYTKYKDHELFNEYHRILDDINDIEKRHYYEWQDAEYEMDLETLEFYYSEIHEIEREADERGVDLEWPYDIDEDDEDES